MQILGQPRADANLAPAALAPRPRALWLSDQAREQDPRTAELLACTLLSSLAATLVLAQGACTGLPFIYNNIVDGAHEAGDGPGRSIPERFLANGELSLAHPAAVRPAQAQLLR